MSTSTDHQATTPLAAGSIRDSPPEAGPAQALTALALGLSYAGLTDESHADDLARWHAPELLQEARQRLETPTHLPPVIERRAAWLLERALTRSRSAQHGNATDDPAKRTTERRCPGSAAAQVRSVDGDED